jgi:hypothetical protein
VQTIIGLFGALIAGRQAAKIVRHTGFRAVPRKIWQVLWTGKVVEPEPEPTAAPGASGTAEVRVPRGSQRTRKAWANVRE